MDKQYQVAREFVDNQGKRWRVGEAYKANKGEIDAALASGNIKESQGQQGQQGQNQQDQSSQGTEGQSGSSQTA